MPNWAPTSESRGNLSNGTQAVEKLALAAWDFLAEYHNDPESFTEERLAAIRTAAFRFSRGVKPADDWEVTYGRRLAGALLMWADDPSPENLAPLSGLVAGMRNKELARGGRGDSGGCCCRRGFPGSWAHSGGGAAVCGLSTRCQLRARTLNRWRAIAASR